MLRLGITLLALAWLLIALIACSPSAEGPDAGIAPSILASERTGTTRVSIPSTDGLRLEGILFKPAEGAPRQDAALVLAHAYSSDQTSWWPFAGRLAEEGFTVLTFNFRGYGRSHGAKEIGRIDQDLESALDFLQREGNPRVFLVGASMGGTAAIIVASRRDVAGIAALSAPKEFMGLDGASVVSNVNEAALFIAADGDGEAWEAARWYAGNALAGMTSGVFDRSEHGTELLEGFLGQDVQGMLLRFLNDSLR